MNIGIDIFPLLTPGTGIGNYTISLLRQWVRNFPENNYYLIDRFTGMSVFRAAGDNLNDLEDMLCTFYPLLHPLKAPILSLYACRRRFSDRSGQSAGQGEGNVDIFFGSDFHVLRSGHFKTAMTIHDMSHKYYPETIPKGVLGYLNNGLPEAVRKADIIIAVSENTKNDILKFLDVPEEKVKVTYLGVDENFRQVRDSDLLALVRKKYRLPERFILYIGALQPRKNITGLIRAYRILCNGPDFRHKLVIGGGVGWGKRELLKSIEGAGLKDRIVFTGHIGQSDLPSVYTLADLFVFPSLYEGFGLPVLEAMACEVPVTASSASSVPEITDDAAVLFDPRSVESIAGGMRRLLTNNELRKKCVAGGLQRAGLFKWEKCATETMDILISVIGHD